MKRNEALKQTCKCGRFGIGGWTGDTKRGHPLFARVSNPVVIGSIIMSEVHMIDECYAPNKIKTIEQLYTTTNEAGYKLLETPISKAPLLTDEQIREVYNHLKMKPPEWIPEIDRMIAQAQVDTLGIGGKAPLLTDEQLEGVDVPKMVRSVRWEDLSEYARLVAQAQLDVANKHFRRNQGTDSTTP